MTRIFAALQKVFCRFNPTICTINQPIDTEGHALGSPVNATVLQFQVNESKDVKFLPKYVGDKFPNLEFYLAWKCGLTILRDHYFNHMKNLQILTLSHNQISTIESEAFRDLVKVQDLKLGYNLIESLDDKLFTSMVNLEALSLNNNKIKILSPSTFKIPHGKLMTLELLSNVCIDKWYGQKRLRRMEHLESDLMASCAGGV